MTISMSARITDPNCIAAATAHVAAWSATVGARSGQFEIQHGENKPCGAVHTEPFNGGFWIVALPRGCRVFESKDGNALDYAGAENVAAYRGGCTCGMGH